MDAMIEGLTAAFSGDSNKGTKAVGNEDMDTLMVQVVNMDKDPVPIKLVQQKAAISANPTPQDLVAKAGDIYASIPAGFLLLHNDLSEILEKLTAGAKTSKEGEGGAGGALAFGGTAGLVAGAVTGLVQGVGNLLSGGGRAGDHMQGIIDDLTMELTADDFRDDPDVQAQIRQGFKDYLSTYFKQQSAALLVSGTIGAVGEGAGEAVVGVLTGLFAGLGLKKKSPLEKITDDIMDSQTSETYIGDSEVDAAVKEGVIGYLKTYFVTQATAMATDTVIGGVGEAAGSAVTGALKSILTLGFAPKSYSKIQGIVDEIVDSETADKYIGDSEVDAAVKEGVIGYLKTYFVTQATAMATDTVIGGVGDAAGSAVTGLLKNVFSLGNASKSYDRIQNIVDDIVDAQTAENYIGDTDVGDAVKEGIVGYLKTYFTTQATAMATDTVVSGLGDAAGSCVGGLLRGILTLGLEKNKTYSKIQEIVDEIVAAQSSDSYAGEEDVRIAVKDGLISYMKTYFSLQTAKMATDEAASLPGEAADAAVKGLLTNIFSLGNSEKSYTRIQNIIDDVIDVQSSDAFVSDEVVQTAVRDGIISYMKGYFSAQTASMLLDTTASSLGSSAAGAVTSFFTGLFGKKNDDKSYDKIQEIVDTVIQAQSAGNFIGDEIVETAVREGVGDYIRTYFKMQASSMMEDLKKDSLGTTVLGAATKFISGIFGLASGKEETKSYDKVQEIIDTVIAAQSAGNFIGDEIVENAVKEGIGEYIKAYFRVQTEGMMGKEVASSLGDKVKNFATSLLGGIFGKKTEKDTSTSKLASILAEITDNIKADDFTESKEIKEAKKDGVAAAVKRIYEIETAELSERYDSQISNKMIKNNFSSTSEEYVEAIKSAVQIKTGDINSEKVQSAKQQGIANFISTYFSRLNSSVSISVSGNSAEVSKTLTDKFIASLQATDVSFLKSPYLEFTISSEDKGRIAKAFTDRLIKSIDESEIEGDYDISEGLTPNLNVSSEAEIQTVELLTQISTLLTSLHTVIEEIKENGGGVTYIDASTSQKDPGLE